MKLFIVHDAGRTAHLTSDRLFMHLAALPAGEIISDREAQTIAAQWHSPAEPLSTVLSTRGMVDMRMSRETFASDSEYNAASESDRKALDALAAYISHHIAAAPSGVRSCECRDCFEIIVGIVGEMCDGCEEAGCEYGTECSRDDAYGVGTCPACGEPSDYCRGHGPSGDPDGFRAVEAHGMGNHDLCVTDCD